MQRDAPSATPALFGGGSTSGGDFELPGPLSFLPLLLIQGGGMDISRVGERIISSVRSAASLGLLPSPSDRPEVPARAAAAAAAARAIAGLPPHQRISLPSSSEDLVSIYGSNPEGQSIDELEDIFYEEDFDPVKYILGNFISEEDDASYLDKQATLRLAQLDKIAECLAIHVMKHHEKMVKGMQLVTELEKDLKVARVICLNGRRCIASSKHEVSRDLVVNQKSKKKQALLDMIPILSELHHATVMQKELDTLVEEGNYFQALQLLPEYLQVLENYSGLSAIKEMGNGVEAWLGRTIQKLDAHLLGVCQSFKEESYLTVIDAYAVVGDVSGMAEKMQSFFLQEVISQTHAVLKEVLEEELGSSFQRNRLTYSDICARVPEPKFRLCLLKTLACLFQLMCSYYSIMIFNPEEKSSESQTPSIASDKGVTVQELEDHPLKESQNIELTSTSYQDDIVSENVVSSHSKVLPESGISEQTKSLVSSSSKCEVGREERATLEVQSPFWLLRKDAAALVGHTLERGRRNLWQLATSRLSVLLSCTAICLTSTQQFLRNYEDISAFILAGEAFCGFEAGDVRQKLKYVCENFVGNFHRQNVYALKMVLERESWVQMSAEATQAISLAGLTGDGAPLISSPTTKFVVLENQNRRYVYADGASRKRNGFVSWLDCENPFLSRLENASSESPTGHLSVDPSTGAKLSDKVVAQASTGSTNLHSGNGSASTYDEENEDLLADFIDEDSQLPSRIFKAKVERSSSTHWKDEDISSQTGSSLSLLRSMDKCARLMQKLLVVNVELFKGIQQLFGIFYHYIYETFGHLDRSQNGKLSSDVQSSRLRVALAKISQDCDQWIRPQNLSFSASTPTTYNTSFHQLDVLPTAPSAMSVPVANTSFGLKERCAAIGTLSLVSRILSRSRSHLQSMLAQTNSSLVEEFFGTLVASVPDLIEHIHRTSTVMLLHINGYAEKIANAKWEVKEIGLEHNGYVDLLLGEFKHFKTRLSHGGISKEIQDQLLDYGLESIAEVLIEGLSRVKKCTDEGRALMSLDLQVLINGLQHLVSANVKPKLQTVETFIKAYYLPETEYVHWARAHPEYSKSQIFGLVNLVAGVKGWKRKTRLEVLEKIEAGS